MNATVPELPKPVADLSPGGVADRGRSEPVTCVRCGYDLSALPPLWAESCPTRGVCSECGLEFEWSELLAPVTAPPEWFAERAGSRFPPGPMMSLRTWWHALTPGRFWSAIGLRHRVDLNAMFGFTMISVLMLYAAAMAWVLFRGVQLGWFGGGRRPPSGWQWLALTGWPWRMSTSVYFWLAPLAACIAPMVFLVLGATLSKSKAKLVHVLRAGVYGLLGVATIMLGFRLARVAILSVDRRRNIGVPTDPWEFLVVCGFKTSWAMLAAFVWLGWCWWHAITRYLRLPEPRLVHGAVMIIAFLGAMAVAQYWGWPRSGWEWYRVDLVSLFFW